MPEDRLEDFADRLVSMVGGVVEVLIGGVFFRRIPNCCWHDDFCLKFSIKKGQLFFQNYGPKSNQIDHVFNFTL